MDSSPERRPYQFLTTSGGSDSRGASPRMQRSQGSGSTESTTWDEASLRRTSPADSPRPSPPSSSAAYDDDGEDPAREISFVVCSTEDLFCHDPCAAPWFENSTVQLVFAGDAARPDSLRCLRSERKSRPQEFSTKKRRYTPPWRKLSGVASSPRRQSKPGCFSP